MTVVRRWTKTLGHAPKRTPEPGKPLCQSYLTVHVFLSFGFDGFCFFSQFGVQSISLTHTKDTWSFNRPPFIFVSRQKHCSGRLW